MKNKTVLLFLFLITLFLVSTTFAQPVELRIQILNADKFETVYASDIDILQLGAVEEFFIIGIYNYGDQTFRGNRLILRFIKDGQLLAKTESELFSIPPQLVSDNIATNVDLMNNNYYLGPTSERDYMVRITESKLVTDEITDIEQDILSSGKFPIGSYILEGFLLNEGGSYNPIETFDEFIITNPSFVQLVAPGGEAGSGFVDEEYADFPIFQWNGNGKEYQVLVFEKKFALQSLDNVLSSNPNWKSERLNAFSAQYPQSGGGADGVVIPLEYGKTYYWLVKMFIQTSSGEEDINSEIWEFKLVDPLTLGDEQGKLARNQLIDFLRDLIGNKADALARQLADYDVRTINFNGREIDIQELYQIINQYRLKQVEVVDLILPTGSN